MYFSGLDTYVAANDSMASEIKVESRWRKLMVP
jgi:hypothetical protein